MTFIFTTICKWLCTLATCSRWESYLSFSQLCCKTYQTSNLNIFLKAEQQFPIYVLNLLILGQYWRSQDALLRHIFWRIWQACLTQQTKKRTNRTFKKEALLGLAMPDEVFMTISCWTIFTNNYELLFLGGSCSCFSRGDNSH